MTNTLNPRLLLKENYFGVASICVSKIKEVIQGYIASYAPNRLTSDGDVYNTSKS